MKKRCLMIGAGGMARSWIRRFLPNFSDRIEIVGLVDIDPGVLEEQSDFLGLADKDHYTCTAEAVGAATLCRFERSALDDLVQRQSCLEGHLLDRARAELADGRSQLLLLGHKTARERVASFILTQSARAVQRGLSASPVETPMRRADIADHLGLTTETVSRTLTNLTNDGLIGVEAGRRIIIRDAVTLAALAAGHEAA